jgi:inhibitor of cysteine peptidase
MAKGCLYLGMGMDSSMKVGENDDGKVIELMVGQILEVELRENPSTGFRWELSAIGPELKKLPKEKYLPDSKAIGAGGRRTMEFEALRTGSAKILLEERRPWEADSPPVKRFRIEVKVIPPWLKL